MNSDIISHWGPIRRKESAGKAFKTSCSLAGWDDVYHSVTVCGYKLIFIPYIFSEEEAYDFDIRLVQIRFLKKDEN